MSNTSPSSIPSPLIDAVREGRVVLFLGAGASYGALHPHGNKVPDGNHLRDLICDKFLDNDMKSSSLMECSDYAIDSHDLTTFQQFIRETFIDFSPAEFHKLIPTFNWTAIFTTNYDLILERSYDQSRTIIPLVTYIKNGQKIDLELKQKANALLLTKLHGSIDHYLDADIPLVLSSDQYVSVSKNRRMLFDRLLNLGSQCPVVFVGYRANVLHIKTILAELSDMGQRRPRYFYISPHVTHYQRSYLEARRITCIPISFETFLTALDHDMPSSLRAIYLDIDKALAPIGKHIRVHKPKASGDLASFLASDVDPIYSTMPLEPGNNSDFYEGVLSGFSILSQITWM
jgi:hypothetical protein